MCIAQAIETKDCFIVGSGCPLKSYTNPIGEAFEEHTLLHTISSARQQSVFTVRRDDGVNIAKSRGKRRARACSPVAPARR